jgi:hypothetical protein
MSHLSVSAILFRWRWDSSPTTKTMAPPWYKRLSKRILLKIVEREMNGPFVLDGIEKRMYS